MNGAAEISFEQPLFDVTVGVASGEFDGVGDEREGGQDVGELGFRQAVEVGDQAVQFGVEFVVGLGRFNPRRNSAGVMIGIL